MNDKETEILAKIVPQLKALSKNLWQHPTSTRRRLDSIIAELDKALTQENQGT